MPGDARRELSMEQLDPVSGAGSSMSGTGTLLQMDLGRASKIDKIASAILKSMNTTADAIVQNIK